MTLAGSVALVTGATGGIGQAITSRFLAEGVRLVLSGRRERWGVPHGCRYLPGDIRDEAYVIALVREAQTAFGGLDVLVNCHGLDYHSDLPTTELADAREVLEVNVLAVVLTMKHSIPAMIERGGGAIVNIGSRLGQVAIPGQAVYGASKAALAQLSRGAAIDYAAKGIRVNTVAPGITDTEMIGAWVRDQPDAAAFQARLVAGIPLRRMATPDDIAAAVAFLASDDARYITGATIPVDGGYTAQ